MKGCGGAGSIAAPRSHLALGAAGDAQDARGSPSPRPLFLCRFCPGSPGRLRCQRLHGSQPVRLPSGRSCVGMEVGGALFAFPRCVRALPVLKLNLRSPPGCSKNTTMSGCLAACCANRNCTAWNYHVSSTNPMHNVRSCWLTTAEEPRITLASHDESDANDVWYGHVSCPALSLLFLPRHRFTHRVGGSSKSVRDCTDGGCTAPAPPTPQWPAGSVCLLTMVRGCN